MKKYREILGEIWEGETWKFVFEGKGICEIDLFFYVFFYGERLFTVSL